MQVTNAVADTGVEEVLKLIEESREEERHNRLKILGLEKRLL